MESVRLTTFTTSYVAEEDRIAVDAMTSESETIRVWLTRRLLKRLLPTLYEKVLMNLSPSTSAQVAAAPKKKKKPNASAKDKQEKAAPIVFSAGSPVVLATGASYQSSEKMIRVQFNEEAKSYEIFFTPENLCSWFSIIQRLCRIAEWPLEEFITAENSSQKFAEMNTISSVFH